MILVSLLAIPALILINAFFVAVEYSLVALRKTRVEELVNNRVRGAKAVAKATANLNRTIAATQLGITLVSIALGAVGEPVLAGIIEPVFWFVPEEWRWLPIHSLATVSSIIIITLLEVVLGEQVPKLTALQVPDRTALWLARPLNVFARIVQPLLVLMNGVSGWLLRRMGLKSSGPETSIHTVDELRLIIEDTQEAGLLEFDQAKFVQNVFELTDKTVCECMLPREKIDALEIGTPSQEIVEKVRDWGHTRIPVYAGDLDNIVGILNTKNLFYFFSLGNAVVLDDALYTATFLEPDVSIAKALRRFRFTRRPMAIVRDKQGHVLGLITLEDILEEIVGELEDEHDAPPPPPRRRKTKR